MDYLQDVRGQFRMYQDLAEKAIARVDNQQFFKIANEQANSMALIVKHMAGNMRSRWTDFLSADGEKPDRDRDNEFQILPDDTRENLLDRWTGGWQLVYQALDQAETVGLDYAIRIRAQPYTVLQAINRQLTHYAYHVGQIVLLAVHYLGADWESLSVPRGKSEEFNVEMRARYSSED